MRHIRTLVMRPAGFAAGLIVLSLLAGACMTYGRQEGGKAAPPDNGLKFDHAIHTEQGIGCTDCHAFVSEEDRAAFAIPSHDMCSTCHDIPEDLTPSEACAYCHTNDTFEITRISVVSDDIQFVHGPHVDKEIDCAVCHDKPDERKLVKGPLKPFCMDCHGKTDPKLNECSVCHKETSKDAVPKYRSGSRIPHDSPEIWENVHGRESMVDPQYCALCHDAPNECDACHAQNPPKDHTISWRRKTHGIEATWNRNKCAVCHEEDSCIQCHSNTEPSSHRGGWGSPINRHCVSCHYPPEKTDCVVCHETIEHATAIPSPHNVGVFPANCALCHPGGLPHQAPHLLNSTVHCLICHK